MKILVTGAAGFIGSALSKKLAENGEEVVGIDNLNNYYDPKLKIARLKNNGLQEDEYLPNQQYFSQKYSNLSFIKMDIVDNNSIQELFKQNQFDKVMHLAAQTGVRYSIQNPYTYIETNVMGFINILEACRHNNIKHLVYASSSSVYGTNDKVPFSEKDEVVTPVSIYAASKKANELMAYSYSQLYNLSAIGIRLFTVYGPWGRPDMAPFLFANSISKNKAINVFNNGDLQRDFTYIDDIVNGIILLLDYKIEKEVPSEIFNIGCSKPIKLMNFIEELEKNIGQPAQKNFLPMQKGDMYKTYADTSKLENATGYQPKVMLKEGIKYFIDWFKSKDNPLK